MLDHLKPTIITRFVDKNSKYEIDLDVVMPFGKFKGKTIAQISKEAPWYPLWFWNNNDEGDDCCETYPNRFDTLKSNTLLYQAMYYCKIRKAGFDNDTDLYVTYKREIENYNGIFNMLTPEQKIQVKKEIEERKERLIREDKERYFNTMKIQRVGETKIMNEASRDNRKEPQIQRLLHKKKVVTDGNNELIFVN